MSVKVKKPKKLESKSHEKIKKPSIEKRLNDPRIREIQDAIEAMKRSKVAKNVYFTQSHLVRYTRIGDS